MRPPVVFILIFIGLSLGAFIAPAAPFTVDGGIYYEMAHAMASRGELFIASNGGVDGAPPLTKSLTIVNEGKVYPQYPGGYALIAYPFYVVFGIQGLMLMNALGFAACICLTYSIGRRLYDRQIGQWAAMIFSIATFAPTYAFGIWPHSLSLALLVGGIYCAVSATQVKARRDEFMLLASAGLLIGAGVNIRIDVALGALVIFFWLRLFARPKDRLAPVALVAGLLPGLWMAAYINALKFGTFTPFSYGPSAGNDSLERYAPVIVLALSAIVLVWMVNAPWLAARAWRQYRWRGAAAIIILAGFLMLITPFREMLWRCVTGVYVLAVNLQAHDAYAQDGVARNEYGHLLFWGYPKKALIQSIPWAPLIIIPIFMVIRGKNTASASLCLFAIAAPICFYALNHWHGGGSYSMRYFMPALPFFAILGAYGLRELTTRAGPKRQTVLLALAAAAVVCLGFQIIGQSDDRYYAPAMLYPQWIIAAAVAVSAIFTLTRPFGEKPRIVASSVALFAITYGVAVNLFEEIGHEKTRFEQLARANAISAPIASHSLVVTASPLSFIPAEQRGANVIVITSANITETALAMRAFADAGLCVFVHNSYARDLIEPVLNWEITPQPVFAPSRRFKSDPRLAFYLLANTREKCWKT
ncbi:ArnT family glycosyltransferase [Hyphococcus sp.]|uniref:ArnT family glycosyltransferase n=1 Tax=Hyphococcus sp. TaxID=2038636 RepID=UPI003CCC2884